MFLRRCLTARTIVAKSGGDNADFTKAMVEDDEAVVEADVAVGQFQVVDGAARQFGFGEIFQVVAPVAKRAAERKGQVDLIQQFTAGHERIEDVPRVAELKLGSGIWGLGS